MLTTFTLAALSQKNECACTEGKHHNRIGPNRLIPCDPAWDVHRPIRVSYVDASPP